MPEALALLKRELGGDAIILGTRVLASGGIRGLLGAERVEITASLPAHPATTTRPPIATKSGDQRHAAYATQAGRAGPKSTASTSDLATPRVQRQVTPPAGTSTTQAAIDPAAEHSTDAAAGHAVLPELMPHYLAMLRQEVGEQLASAFMQEARAELGDRVATDTNALRTVLARCVARRVPAAGGIQLEEGRTRRVALVGPAGAGKTTTLAKLAAHYALRLGKRVAILSLDMHRPATHEQMRRCAETIGVPVFVAESVAAVKDVLRALPPLDLLLIDTHGVGPREQASFVRLAAMVRAARPDETHLVLPASMAAAAQERATRTFEPLGVSRVVLSRVDEAIGLGAVLTALDRLGWGVSYLTDGQKVPSDLHEATGTRLAEYLLADAN